MSFNPKAKTLAEIEQKEVNKKAIDKLGAKFNPETGKKAPFFIKIDHQYPNGEKGALFIFGKIKKYKATTKDLKGNTELHGLAYVEYDEQRVSTLCLAPSKGKLDEKEILLKKAMKDTFKETYKRYRLLDRVNEEDVDAADDDMEDEAGGEEEPEDIVEDVDAKRQAQIADLRKYQARFLSNFEDYKKNKDASKLPVLKSDIDKFQYVYSLSSLPEFESFFNQITSLEGNIERIQAEKELTDYAQRIKSNFSDFRKNKDKNILPLIKTDIDEFQRIYATTAIEDEELKSFYAQIAKLEEQIDKENFVASLLDCISENNKKAIKDGWTVADIARFNADYPDAYNAFKVFLDNSSPAKLEASKKKIFELLTVWRGCSNGVQESRKNPNFLNKLHEISFVPANREKFVKHLQGNGSGFGVSASSGARRANATGGHIGQEADQEYALEADSSKTEPHILFHNSKGQRKSLVDIAKEKDALGVLKNVNALGVIKMPADYTLEIAQYKIEPNGKYVEPKQIIGRGAKPTPDGQTFFPLSMSVDEIFEQAASAFTNPIQGSWGSIFSGRLINTTPKAQSENGLIIRWFETNGKINSFFPEF